MEPGDFRVEEILGFEPSGDGQHDFLLIEKTLMDTDRVAGILARYAGVSRRAVSYSGLKDRRAVTRQWFSVELPATRRCDWQALDEPAIRVCAVERNRRKLRRGAHSENSFELLLRDIKDPGDRLESALTRVQAEGVPNYFGEQRFGRGGGNIPLAASLFEGRRLSRPQRSIAISAARSLIFNDILSARVADGSWNQLADGDIANLDGTGSVFAVETVTEELRDRCGRFDIHPTGPLWGRAAPGSGLAVAEAEQAAASAYPDLCSGLESVAAEGRRALRVLPRDLRWEKDAGNLRLSFGLGRGSYATAVLRELLNTDIAI